MAKPGRNHLDPSTRNTLPLNTLDVTGRASHCFAMSESTDRHRPEASRDALDEEVDGSGSRSDFDKSTTSGSNYSRAAGSDSSSSPEPEYDEWEPDSESDDATTTDGDVDKSADIEVPSSPEESASGEDLPGSHASRRPITRPTLRYATCSRPPHRWRPYIQAEHENRALVALRAFDSSSKYGPCVGMSRMERWERARLLRLSPPAEVHALLSGNRGHWQEYSQCVFDRLL
uniref:DNA polymerase delta subunit 4 n=1 Tax=Mycena chlorophos TaxID=658473 RepID=A0ABQ0LU82_MYCCL|nr:predicted protein [Mycena chlorophos]